MKNNKLILLLFAIVALIQLATPLHMAWRWENILQTGQQFYWQTAPVDPYDAFKGRYIDLRFKETTGPLADNSNLVYGQTAYAAIAETEQGNAYISSVSTIKPVHGPYLKVKVQYVEGNTVHIELPFKRYYLPEGMATAAEAAYREKADQTGMAAVRIKDGYAVIEQLYIDGQTLVEYLQNN